MNTLKSKIKWNKKTALCLIFLLCGVFLLMFVKFIESGKDYTAPSLYVAGEKVEFTEGEDESILIKGIRAEDDIDGDVTDTIRIRNIYFLDNSSEAIVTYIAKDNSNNVGSAQRRIQINRFPQEIQGDDDAVGPGPDDSAEAGNTAQNVDTEDERRGEQKSSESSTTEEANDNQESGTAETR